MKSRRYTVYAVTNRRAFIIEQSLFFFPPFPLDRFTDYSYGPLQLAGRKQRVDSDGSGDLIFETRIHSHGEGQSRQSIGFINIPDVEVVERLLQKFAGNQPPTSEPLPTTDAFLSKLPLAPYVSDAPRRVPWAIQWRLFSLAAHPGMLLVGLIFLAGSTFFLVLMWSAAGDRSFESLLWRLFPLIHFGIGLVLIYFPLAGWRRRVRILRHGILVPVRILAYRDANLGGSWRPFTTEGFANAKWFAGGSFVGREPRRLDKAPEAGALQGIARGAGCLLAFFAVFGIVFGGVFIGLIWLGENANQHSAWEKLGWTALVMLGTAVYVGIAFLMWRSITRLFREFSGAVAPEDRRRGPMADLRFAYLLPDGTRAQAETRVDMRSRLLAERWEGEDIAVCLPSRPQQVLLLDTVWPALRIHEGNWV